MKNNKKPLLALCCCSYFTEGDNYFSCQNKRKRKMNRNITYIKRRIEKAPNGHLALQSSNYERSDAHQYTTTEGSNAGF